MFLPLYAPDTTQLSIKYKPHMHIRNLCLIREGCVKVRPLHSPILPTQLVYYVPVIQNLYTPKSFSKLFIYSDGNFIYKFNFLLPRVRGWGAGTVCIRVV